MLKHFGLGVCAVSLLAHSFLSQTSWAETVQSTETVLSAAHDPLAYGPDREREGILVSAPHGMVVSAQRLASEAGAEILKKGGNAVDAAVAVGYALAVVYPAAGNLGGGGFMTLYLGHGNNNPGPGVLRHHHTVFVDFREHAPLAAKEDMYLDASGQVIAGASSQGWKAVAVPGTVAGLEAIRERWGRLSREQDMAPAIALARDGFVLEEGDIELFNPKTSYFKQDPYARSIFLRPDGSPLQVGDRLVQSNLAQTLSAIARDGSDAFYHGDIAREILRVSQKGGGILTQKDFDSYGVRLDAPLHCQYRGYDIHTAPPPSGGGVALCEMLNILQFYDMAALGLHTAPALQREIEAMRQAYADRQDLGDPDFVKDVPNKVAHLIDPAYAEKIKDSIPLDHAVSSESLRKPSAEMQHEKHETTQFSVIDKNGMAVSATYTLDGWFGAGVMAGKTGIWMNDEMDDFATKPGAPNMFGIIGSVANKIAPGKAPLSSMSPTIITKNDHVVMVTGSPGGSRIPTITLSMILGVIDYGLPLNQAVDLPRIHEQWMPDNVEIETGAVSQEVAERLTQEGYHLIPHRHWGIMEAILVGQPSLKASMTGMVYGASDPRHPGGAAIGE